MLHDEKRHPLLTNPKFRSHVRAHQQISSNEFWYGDKASDLGPRFTAAKTQERATVVNQILLRAAKRADKTGSTDMAEAYYQLADKIESCCPRGRCGSLACPRCARAFQKAKAAA